jgi:membrane protein implicated in regulation of membrane protease activity
VSGEPERAVVRFEPLRPASRGRMIAAFALGPLFWLVALIVAAWVLEYTESIALGLLFTVASFVVSLVVLALVYSARRRQEEGYDEGG